MSLSRMGVSDGSHKKNKEIFSSEKYGGYFCVALYNKLLCLDLKRSVPILNNPRCFRLTPDLSPIAAQLAIDLIGPKAVNIKGKTYFVGGEYGEFGAYSLKPDLYRLRLQPERKGTPEFLLLEPGFAPDAVDFPPKLSGVKADPIVEEIGDKIYVLGGAERTLVFEVLDPRTLTWSTLPDPPPFEEHPGYPSESFNKGHSVIGKRLFILSYDGGCAFFDTEQGKWHALPRFVYPEYVGQPPGVGRILLWPGYSCGAHSSIKVPRNGNNNHQQDKDHYICFMENNIYLVDSDGRIWAQQKNAVDAIVKGLTPSPFIESFTHVNGMVFLPSPHEGSMCAAILFHPPCHDDHGGCTIPRLCISFFRAVMNSSVVNSILDGSYQDANPDADFTNLNLVDVLLDHGYVFDFAEHFDNFTGLGFCGPVLFL